ncbi:MAG: ATP-binding protein [Clostridiales bacterium]|nr:ATP-binding protein [Clostridiales bacterium]
MDNNKDTIILEQEDLSPTLDENEVDVIKASEALNEKMDKLVLYQAISDAEFLLTKQYQYNLDQYTVVPPDKSVESIDISSNTRFFKLESIAYKQDENNLVKLSNVYTALSSVQGSVIILMDSDGEKIDFYMGTKTDLSKDIYIAYKTLEKSLKGNFPGCVVKNQYRSNVEKTVSEVFRYRDDSSIEEDRVISVVNGISSIREIDTFNDRYNFSQGIEKLIDSMSGEVYSAIFIADPVKQNTIDDIRRGYENIYTKLVPFSSMDLSISHNDNHSVSDSVTSGISDTISESLTLSQSHTHTESTSSTKGKNGGLSVIVASAGKNSSKTDTVTDSYTNTRAETKGTSNTKSYTEGITEAISTGKSYNMQIKTEEKSVKTLLDRIDIQLNRLSECSDLGMWNFAAYFIADDYQISKTVASTYQALIRGEHSGIEAITVNTWKHEDDPLEAERYKHFSAYVKKLVHPQILIDQKLPVVNPTSLISGLELTIQSGIPQQSVQGLAVSKYAAFGRDILYHTPVKGQSLEIGDIYHMGIASNTKVKLSSKSLAAHTFVTGSTGSGKSNTIYQILNKLSVKKIPFLVIEPAKGEYKHVFSKYKNINVFGTNPYQTQMLRINPFKFPEEIHVLEHIDRLTEIFNVCWPMYAAMPAILKEAIEAAYKEAGWDLEVSVCQLEEIVYPTFKDLLNQLHIVVESSDFSGELKGNYIGALVTRVKSLTNGLNKQIFVYDEVDQSNLFDQNCIVDLSRVASSESKSLIMGMLILKLQEHRMAIGGMNKPLKHVTVLEEAHHLLKRTAVEQSSEQSNVLGKSVEMLSHSIAEMRTYGEGFIIADQSPNMLDLSVIRNTNTKIILRLPEKSDRELVGHAANLTEEQVTELSKLPTGVAAIYQSNWIEPVLCKVEMYDTEELTFNYKGKPVKGDSLKPTIIKCLLADCVEDKVRYSMDEICDRILHSNYDVMTKRLLLDTFRNRGRTLDDVMTAVTSLFDVTDIFDKSYRSTSMNMWHNSLIQSLGLDYTSLDIAYKIAVLQCILKSLSVTDSEFEIIYYKWLSYMEEN